MMRHAIVAAVLCMAVAAFAVDPDFITNLPGAPANLGYDQYAGYLTVNQTNGRQLFYWFVESQNSPSTDPVVLWLNGGPGCSSLLGAFGENGPLWINKDGATLRKNPSSWNRVANVIYLESPAGVGFSTSNVTSDYTVGDSRTAMDAYIFLVKFFAKFPQFANLPFWVSGESYGGHYVPNLAKTILEQNAKGINPKVNLVGFQVGNAWTDATIDNEMSVHFWHSHALISDESAAGALANCDFSKIGPLKGEADDACDNYLDQATTAMAGINIYEIYSDICLEGGRAEAAQLVRALANSGARTAFTKQMAHALSANRVGAAAGEEVSLRDEHPDADPCIDNHLAAYMNRKEVQKAIHANINYPWTGCSSIINYSYADLLSSMLPVYKWLLTNPVKLQMLVYSGDIDAIVSVMGTRAWLQKLALPIKEQWRPYKVDQQVGGWTVKYDGLTFATVRDAGHMVPWVQPERSFYIFSKFLKQQPF